MKEVSPLSFGPEPDASAAGVLLLGADGDNLIFAAHGGQRLFWVQPPPGQ